MAPGRPGQMGTGVRAIENESSSSGRPRKSKKLNSPQRPGRPPLRAPLLADKGGGELGRAVPTAACLPKVSHLFGVSIDREIPRLHGVGRSPLSTHRSSPGLAVRRGGPLHDDSEEGCLGPVRAPAGAGKPMGAPIIGGLTRDRGVPRVVGAWKSRSRRPAWARPSAGSSPCTGPSSRGF